MKKVLFVLIALLQIPGVKAQDTLTSRSSSRIKTVVISVDTESAIISAQFHSNAQTPFCEVAIRWSADTNWNIDSGFYHNAPKLLLDKNMNDYIFHYGGDTIRTFQAALGSLKPFTTFYAQAVIIYIHPPTSQQLDSSMQLGPRIDSICYGRIIPFTPLSPLHRLSYNVILSGDQAVCPVQGSWQPNELYASLPMGGRGGYQYHWIRSRDSGKSWSDAAGTGIPIHRQNFKPFSLSAMMVQYWAHQIIFRRVVTSGSETDTSQAVYVTFISNNTSENINVIEHPNNISNGNYMFLLPVMNPVYGTYYIQWQDSTKGSTGYSDIETGHIDTLMSSTMVPDHYYRVQISYDSALNQGSGPLFISPVVGTSPADGSGNVYPTVTMGTQTWFMGNLRTTRFNDGTPIQQIFDAGAWASATAPAYCWYNYDSLDNSVSYGGLYNYYTITTNNKNVCPVGWHVSTAADWSLLVSFTRGTSSTGPAGAGLLRVADTWYPPNSTQNQYNFNAMPGGNITKNGLFQNRYFAGKWWARDNNITHYEILNFSNIIYSTNTTGDANSLNAGYSIRCVKNHNQ